MTLENSSTATVDTAASTPVAADATTETMSRAEAQKIIAQRDELKRKLAELAPLADAGKKAIDASKTAEERLAAVTAENATLRTTAEEATMAMNTVLAAEINAISEAMRVLIPSALSPAKQLEWISSAHAAGLFGVKSSSPGAQIPGSAGGATITQTELANMPNGAKRTALMASVREGKVSVVAG